MCKGTAFEFGTANDDVEIGAMRRSRQKHSVCCEIDWKRESADDEVDTNCRCSNVSTKRP